MIGRHFLGAAAMSFTATELADDRNNKTAQI